MGVETTFTGKQLYKARALYEEEKHSLKLQLNSVHENVNVLKRENENLRFSLTHSQADLETFRKQERWESSQRITFIYVVQCEQCVYVLRHGFDSVSVACKTR